LLDECNRLELIEQTKNPTQQEKLIADLTELVKQTYPDDVKNLELNSDHIKKVLGWSVGRITNLNELVEGQLSFLWVLPAKSNHNLSKDTLEELVTTLTAVDSFQKESLNSILKEFSKNQNVKFSELMTNIRVILSGFKEGPGVPEMMEILGKQSTLKRIQMKKSRK